MKRTGFFLLLRYSAVFAFLIAGCKKETADEDTPPINNTPTVADTIAPVITLNGSSTVLVTLNSSYTDDGATASDTHDGAVSVTSDLSTSNPDADQAAIYTITYSAVDSAGNTAHATRTVTVRNDAYYLEGNYDCIENGIYQFPQTISASPTVNNRIVFSKFADYSNNSSIYANVSGTTVIFPTQTAAGIGSSGCTHTFYQNGAGNNIALVSSKATFSIKFADDQQAGGGCQDTNPVMYEDVFMQQ